MKFLNSEQILFRCKFHELKKRYTAEEIAKLTGLKLGLVKIRMNLKRARSEESITSYYKRNYVRKVGDVFYFYKKSRCG